MVESKINQKIKFFNCLLTKYLGVSISNDKNTVISKTKIVYSNVKIVLNRAFNFTYKKLLFYSKT